MRFGILLILPFMIFSCNMYRIAEKHVNKKMSHAELSIQTASVNGDIIEYWDNHKKEKPVLVLIHGFGATTKYQWFKQVEMLSENYRLIIPNLLYFGNSKPSIPKYELQDQVNMIVDFLKEKGVSQYTLCGVSYGGLISMEIAQNYPVGIDKLVIFDAPIKFMNKGDFSRIKNEFGVPSIEELFVPTKPKGLKKLMRLATGKPSYVPSSWLKEFHEVVYASNKEDKRKLITGLINGLDEYANKTYTINIPTLLIWGHDDKVVPAARGELLNRHLGDVAEYHVIRKGSHMPNLTQTKKFNKILSEFLERPISE